MFKISNFTRENKPPGRSARVAGPIAATTIARLVPGPALIAGRPDLRFLGARIGTHIHSLTSRTGRTNLAEHAVRAGRALVLVAVYLAAWPAAVPRRLGDRLFTINDNEAYWRDWQIIRVHGGLGRRYRHPWFDTLAECPKCHGAGLPPGVQAACAPCLGTGRITVEGVN